MAVKRTVNKMSADFLAALNAMKNPKAEAGWFESAKYPDGTPVAYVATIQEFGSPKNSIPPRPFMRPTLAEKSGEWKALALRGAKAMARGNETIGTVMEKLGSKAAGDIRKTISNVNSPALKDATIKARLSKRANKKTVGNLTKPLVDTGLMLSTCTHKVSET